MYLCKKWHPWPPCLQTNGHAEGNKSFHCSLLPLWRGTQQVTTTKWPLRSTVYMETRMTTTGRVLQRTPGDPLGQTAGRRNRLLDSFCTFTPTNCDTLRCKSCQLSFVNVSAREDNISPAVKPSGSTFLQSSKSGKVCKKYNNGYTSIILISFQLIYF